MAVRRAGCSPTHPGLMKLAYTSKTLEKYTHVLLEFFLAFEDATSKTRVLGKVFQRRNTSQFRSVNLRNICLKTIENNRNTMFGACGKVMDEYS